MQFLCRPLKGALRSLNISYSRSVFNLTSPHNNLDYAFTFYASYASFSTTLVDGCSTKDKLWQRIIIVSMQLSCIMCAYGVCVCLCIMCARPLWWCSAPMLPLSTLLDCLILCPVVWTISSAGKQKSHTTHARTHAHTHTHTHTHSVRACVCVCV